MFNYYDETNINGFQLSQKFNISIVQSEISVKKITVS